MLLLANYHTGPHIHALTFVLEASSLLTNNDNHVLCSGVSSSTTVTAQMSVDMTQSVLLVSCINMMLNYLSCFI